ncbi:unnamed protein product [Aphanomyces euteiches]|nr:hypothetical protein Ae201684P_021463 [Aphanomyces euteiches]KAH9132683.1 hypothetical protein AeRB84_021009 [Aphanomyces euteiches]
MDALSTANCRFSRYTSTKRRTTSSPPPPTTTEPPTVPPSTTIAPTPAHAFERPIVLSVTATTYAPKSTIVNMTTHSTNGAVDDIVHDKRLKQALKPSPTIFSTPVADFHCCEEDAR